MANKVTFDYSKTAEYISEGEITAMKRIAEEAKKLLLSREGEGNDFLGWIDLPVDYDKEEFARIQKAAAKIQSDSDVLLVIGIGGSYLGARAANEFLGPNPELQQNLQLLLEFSRRCLKRNTAKKKLRRGFIAQQIKQEAHLRAWQQKRDMSHLSCLMM